MKQAISAKKILLGGLLLSSIGFYSSCDDKDAPNPPPPGVNNLAKVLTDSGYSNLVGAVTTADLVSVFTGSDNFTVFAPANPAFGGTAIPIPSDKVKLQDLLKYHVVPGNIKAADVIGLSNGNLISVKSVGGDTLWIRASAAKGVFVNGIQVVRPNMSATNGVAHGIGSILFNPTGDIVQTAVALKFDSLVKAVTRATSDPAGDPNLVNALSKTPGLTVFAPTNAAFTALLTALSLTDINQIPIATLVAVLKHHVTGGRVFSSDLSNNQTVAMLNGTNSTITISGSTVKIKGSGNTSANATIAITNVMAKNGVIHAIGNVILP
jgi:transforming growth factor-beta-induced protein